MPVAKTLLLGAFVLSCEAAQYDKNSLERARKTPSAHKSGRVTADVRADASILVQAEHGDEDESVAVAPGRQSTTSRALVAHFPVVGLGGNLLQSSADLDEALARAGAVDAHIWCMKSTGHTTHGPQRGPDGKEIIMEKVTAELIDGSTLAIVSDNSDLQEGIYCCPGEAPGPDQGVEDECAFYTQDKAPKPEGDFQHTDDLIQRAAVSGDGTITDASSDIEQRQLSIPQTVIFAELSSPQSSVPLHGADLKKAAAQIALLARHSDKETVVLVDEEMHGPVLLELGNHEAHSRVFIGRFFGKIVSFFKKSVKKVGKAIDNTVKDVKKLGVGGAIKKGVTNAVKSIKNAVAPSKSTTIRLSPGPKVIKSGTIPQYLAAPHLSSNKYVEDKGKRSQAVSISFLCLGGSGGTTRKCLMRPSKSPALTICPRELKEGSLVGLKAGIPGKLDPSCFVELVQDGTEDFYKLKLIGKNLYISFKELKDGAKLELVSDKKAADTQMEILNANGKGSAFSSG